MTELLTLLSSGQTATTTGQGGNDIVSILTMLIPLALMVVIFYFLIIRPEKKRGNSVVMKVVRKPTLTTTVGTYPRKSAGVFTPKQEKGSSILPRVTQSYGVKQKSYLRETQRGNPRGSRIT